MIWKWHSHEKERNFREKLNQTSFGQAASESCAARTAARVQRNEGQTKKMCSQIYIRHNKKCSFDWSKKMPPECGLDLRGYDQFLYYFCTFLRNRPPSWRITKRRKKWNTNQNIPSGIKFKFWVNCHHYASCIHMPAGAGYLAAHTIKK